MLSSAKLPSADQLTYTNGSRCTLPPTPFQFLLNPTCNMLGYVQQHLIFQLLWVTVELCSMPALGRGEYGCEPCWQSPPRVVRGLRARDCYNIEQGFPTHAFLWQIATHSVVCQHNTLT